MARVTLLNWTPEPMRTMTAAALLCYQRGGPVEAWTKAAVPTVQKRLVAQCAAADHGTVLEHVALTLGIEGISRACSHQLVRHRVCSFDQQSQRYVDLSEDCWEGGNFVRPPSLPPIPPDDEFQGGPTADEFVQSMAAAAGSYEALRRILLDSGLEGEDVNQDARYALPGAFRTNLIWTINFRSLIHVCGVRLCARAQWELRGLMIDVVGVVAAENQTRPLAEYLRPKCQRLGYCDEGSRSCGRMPTKETVIEAARKEGLYDTNEAAGHPASDERKNAP